MKQLTGRSRILRKISWWRGLDQRKNVNSFLLCIGLTGRSFVKEWMNDDDGWGRRAVRTWNDPLLIHMRDVRWINQYDGSILSVRERERVESCRPQMKIFLLERKGGELLSTDEICPCIKCFIVQKSSIRPSNNMLLLAFSFITSFWSMSLVCSSCFNAPFVLFPLFTQLIS